jgi:hypothetical protein
MTLRRAALYAGGASLLAAWFSSAASLAPQRAHEVTRTDTAQPASPIDDVAAEVERQATRLRERLATPPLPQQPLRNPFAFSRADDSPRSPSPPPIAAAQSPPTPAEPPEPPLTLIGLAEQHRPQGTERTAMIATAGDELIMVAVGASVLGRYTVRAISAESVELVETATGRTRIISLR